MLKAVKITSANSPFTLKTLTNINIFVGPYSSGIGLIINDISTNYPDNNIEIFHNLGENMYFRDMPLVIRYILNSISIDRNKQFFFSTNNYEFIQRLIDILNKEYNNLKEPITLFRVQEGKYNMDCIYYSTERLITAVENSIEFR